MALIVPGTGATIKAGTLEGQILECAMKLQNWESDALRNPPPSKDYVQVTLNGNAFQATISYAFPYQDTADGMGRSITSVPDYLVGLTFTSGSDGTFKSSNPAAYLYELSKYAQSLENDSTRNASNANRVSIFRDDDTSIASATITINYSVSFTDQGLPQIVATEYLS